MLRVIENPEWCGAMQQPFSLEALREVLSYDPETGWLVWLKSNSARAKVGERAGSVGKNGRREINVLGRRCFAHHLAWFLHHGEWPTGYVRQKNGDFDDCRIENLFRQTPEEAGLDRALPSNNTSGYRGVSFDKRSGKWQATIRRKYKQMHLGWYETPEAAHAAFVEADKTFRPDVPKEEIERRAREFGVRRRRRAAWALTVRQAGGVTGWASESAFLAEVGDPPGPRYSVVARDSTAPVGPGNWQWVLPRHAQFDMTEPGGRAAYLRHRRRENPAAFRANDLKKSFGITLAEYQEKHDAQGGCCAICGQPETASRDGKTKWLAVDHNHTTQVVRQLLCSSCNVLIGHSRENPAILRAAAAYLERHAACEAEGEAA